MPPKESSPRRKRRKNRRERRNKRDRSPRGLIGSFATNHPWIAGLMMSTGVAITAGVGYMLNEGGQTQAGLPEEQPPVPTLTIDEASDFIQEYLVPIYSMLDLPVNCVWFPDAIEDFQSMYFWMPQKRVFSTLERTKIQDMQDAMRLFMLAR